MNLAEGDSLSADFSAELKRRAALSESEERLDKLSRLLGEDEKPPAAQAAAPPPREAPPAAPRWADRGGDQLERSRKLNSEGLEGLIPRGLQLITLGLSSVLAFWPFILGIAVLFTVTFELYGSDFIHDGESYNYGPSSRSQAARGVPEYVVPEGLLAAPTVDPMVPFNRPQ